jgi:hypothetical protein
MFVEAVLNDEHGFQLHGEKERVRLSDASLPSIALNVNPYNYGLRYPYWYG